MTVVQNFHCAIVLSLKWKKIKLLVLSSAERRDESECLTGEMDCVTSRSVLAGGIPAMLHKAEQSFR